VVVRDIDRAQAAAAADAALALGEATSVPLCLLLKFGASRPEIESVANRPYFTPSHLLAAASSTEICVKPFFFVVPPTSPSQSPEDPI